MPMSSRETNSLLVRVRSKDTTTVVAPVMNIIEYISVAHFPVSIFTAINDDTPYQIRLV